MTQDKVKDQGGCSARSAKEAARSRFPRFVLHSSPARSLVPHKPHSRLQLRKNPWHSFTAGVATWSARADRQSAPPAVKPILPPPFFSKPRTVTRTKLRKPLLRQQLPGNVCSEVSHSLFFSQSERRDRVKFPRQQELIHSGQRLKGRVLEVTKFCGDRGPQAFVTSTKHTPLRSLTFVQETRCCPG